MLIKELNFNLKNGKSALFRSPNKSDADGFLNILRTSVIETDYLLRYPEECDIYTIEHEAEYIDKMNRSIRDALLIWGYRTKRVDGLIPFNKHSVIIM